MVEVTIHYGLLNQTGLDCFYWNLSLDYVLFDLIKQLQAFFDQEHCEKPLTMLDADLLRQEMTNSNFPLSFPINLHF